MRYKDSPFGKIPDTWGISTIAAETIVVTDYVANGSFAALAENVKYRNEKTDTVLIRLVDYNNDFNGDFVYIDDNAYDFLSKSKLFGGEIIISNVGANVGTVFRCPQLKLKMSLGPNAIMVKFKGCDDFYYYWLISHSGQQMLRSLVTGSAQPKFNKTNFREMKIPVPPMAVQEKIASILLAIDRKIDNNKAINHNLQQQAAALFKEWFIDNPDSSSWREGTFSNLIERTISGDWGKDSPTNNNTEMVYCIRGADIPEVRAGNKGKMPIRYILPKNLAAKRLVDGDIVVEISGGSPTQSTGRAAAISDSLLARYDKGMVCTNFCKALKPMAGFSMYVFYYWQYLYDLGVFFSYENGTTGIKNLDINGFLETEPIYIAPAKMIEKFNTFCQSVYAKIYANGLENEQLASIRDMLLPKLMAGEIDVSSVQF